MSCEACKPPEGGGVKNWACWPNHGAPVWMHRNLTALSLEDIRAMLASQGLAIVKGTEVTP